MKNPVKKVETMIEKEAREKMEREVDLKTCYIKAEYINRTTSEKFIFYPVPASGRNMYVNVEVRRYKFTGDSEWTPWEICAAGINTNVMGTLAESELKLALLKEAINCLKARSV